MNVLYQSAFLKALGWSLLDSFWQMGVLWLMYVVLTSNKKKLNSTQKHSLALMSLTGGAVWFLVTLIVRFDKAADTDLITGSNSIFSSIVSSALAYVEPALPFLSIAYLVSVLYLFIRLYRQYSATQKLFYKNLYKARPELRVFLQNIAGRMGIKKDVSIWLSSLVDTPLTIGFWKPVILLPVAAMNQLSLQQAEAIILHELNHIRRNDYFINLLIACMDIILFFNPFVRILTHTIKNERENSCDDMVLQFRYSPGQYASALLLLEQNRSSHRVLALHATGRSRKLLLNRIERILSKKSSGPAVSQKMIAYALSALLIGLIGFYNPGKVIVKTIKTVHENRFSPVASEQVRFTINEKVREEIDASTPASIDEGRIVTAKKQNPADDDLGVEVGQLAEWVSEFTGVDEASVDHPALAAFAGSDGETRDFSIQEPSTPNQPQYNSEPHPYVPSSSFSYQYVEDTTFPKRYVLTQADIKARESLNTALKALQEIDWQKVEKEMAAAGKKVDVITLQKELQKALGDVDWKKVNEEIQSSLLDAENQLLQEHSSLRGQLQKFQEERAQHTIKQQKLYEAIIQDRLCEQKSRVATPQQQPKKVTTKKKIVVI